MREVDRNAPCPCGSRRKYKQCCRKQRFKWLVDDDGNLIGGIEGDDLVIIKIIIQRGGLVQASL